MASYNKINYAVRPAKSIQRKMIVDMLRRLDRFSGGLKSYRYVGFGSPFFSDFKLMHRTLGIDRLTSIEAELDDEERFQYNKPFACIELEMGTSTERLPEIDLSGRSIVWLDYDYAIRSDVLSDLQIVLEVVPTGSVLLVTLDVDPGKLRGRAERFNEHLGEFAVQGVTDETLGGEGIAREAWTLASERVATALADRSVGLADEARFEPRQIMNFRYADGHQMMTLAWIIESQAEPASICGFDEYPFYRSHQQPYCITVPSLTIREMHHLGSQLPTGDVGGVDGKAVPREDIAAYAEQYRWFPAFVDIDL